MPAPLVTIIVPIGPRHVRYVADAARCIAAQTVACWTALFVNDSDDGDELVRSLAEQHLGDRVMVVGTGRRKGVATARNLGLALAETPLVLFYDTDDLLLPEALQVLLAEYGQGGASYTYGDWWAYWLKSRSWRLGGADEYSQAAVLRASLHTISALVETQAARNVGGFEELPGWEDWRFFCRLAVAGYCGRRAAWPTLIYRIDEGGRNARSYALSDQLHAAHRAAFADYLSLSGAKSMSGCCGGSRQTQAAAAAAGAGLAAPEEEPLLNGRVRMEFIGPERGSMTFTVNRRSYRGGNNTVDRYVDALAEDVEGLERTGKWRRVPRAAPPEQLLALVADAGGDPAASVSIGPPPEPIGPFVPEAAPEIEAGHAD